MWWLSPPPDEVFISKNKICFVSQLYVPKTFGLEYFVADDTCGTNIIL